MRPQKEWKSYEEQLRILKQRGLLIKYENKALSYLKTIGYYRLSGYLYPFRKPSEVGQRADDFIENSYFEDAKALYMFDKKLRQLALDGLERIEVTLRCNIAYRLGKYDAIAHTKDKYFDPDFDHKKWLNRYYCLVDRQSKTDFVNHHKKYYGELPIWACTEVWDFGSMSILFKGMKTEDKDAIASLYGIKSGKSLGTQLHALNFIRNVSAHYSRLWNKKVIGRASLKGFNDPTLRALPNNSVFTYFCVIQYLIKQICPNSTWKNRFIDTLDRFPQVQNNAVNLKQFGLDKEIVDINSWNLWT